MKKLLSLMLALCMLATLTGALAEAAPVEAAPAEAAPAEAAPVEATPEAGVEAAAGMAGAAEEPLSVTHHTAEVAGQTLSYTATAGRLPVDVQGNKCQLFFTAYTLDGVENASERPVTFVFNGGPGAGSLWLHMGMLAPRRLDVDEDGQPKSLPVGVVDNPCSILDMTDLVFIDPVGTGYSRAAEGVDPASFYSYSGDIVSVCEFIRLYTTRNGRWGSPKYVAGESYGTVRAVGVADYLSQRYGLGLNGVMLISSINDMGASMEMSGNDFSYALYLPTYAAIAWYHGVLDEKYQSMTLEDYIAEVRDFAGSEFQAALFKGARLTDGERDAIAQKVAAYIGFKVEDVIRANLRIYNDDFCTGLLKDRKLMVGRIDGRYTGPLTDGSIGSGAADPSMNAMSDAFNAALNRYMREELDYQTDLPYEYLSGEVGSYWSYNLDNQVLDQKEIIYNIMSRNKFLKLWVLCGYYDLATPFYPAEWVYDHVFLNQEDRERLSFTYYPCGHMIYMHHPSLEQFRKDAEAWYNK